MTRGTLLGLVTLIDMLAFGAVVWWALGRGRRARFERAARVPLEDSPP